MRATYQRAGVARGRACYVVGAALGAVAIVAAAGAAAVVIGEAEDTIWFGAIAGGAIGALLSVLERLTRGALTVAFESGGLAMSGVSRPVVGALSGLALFALVEGGIVPLDVPSSTTDRGFFFAGVAFLAGFTERLAKDVFGNAASSLSAAPSPLVTGNDSPRRPTERPETPDAIDARPAAGSGRAPGAI